MYIENGTKISGDIRTVHTFLNMTNMPVKPEFTGLQKVVKTCIGSLGDR